MDHQQMGYDRAITMFSPDGRLLQVEYAKKTVKQGSTAVGIVYKEGVLLLSDKRVVDKLAVTESIEKIFPIDDHMAATASGILSDARVLIERAQLEAQQHKVTYDTPIDILSVVKEVSNIAQVCTQSGGLRPFGVGLLIAGIDSKPKLFETDPVGIYFQYYATAIGFGSDEIKQILHKGYKKDMKFEDAAKLGLEAMKKVLGEEFDVNKMDCVKIEKKDKKYTRVKIDELKKLAK